MSMSFTCVALINIDPYGCNMDAVYLNGYMTKAKIGVNFKVLSYKII